MKMLVALALAGLMGSASPALADLRSSLAQRFQADPQFFILNLPPRPGGWPGSIYTYDLLSAQVQVDPNDHADSSATLFDPLADIELDLSGEAERALLPLAGLAGNAAEIATAVMSIAQLRIVAITVPQVRDRIRNIPSADRKTSAPLIVLRSYVGVPQVTFAKKSGADEEAWGNVRAILARESHQSAATSDNKIELRFPETVFAFEVWSVNDVTKLADVPNNFTVETALVIVKGPSEGGADRYKELRFPAEKIPSLDLATTDAGARLKREFEAAGIRHVEKVFAVSGAGAMYVAFVEQDLSKFGLSKVRAEEFEKVRGVPELPLGRRSSSDPSRQP